MNKTQIIGMLNEREQTHLTDLHVVKRAEDVLEAVSLLIDSVNTLDTKEVGMLMNEALKYGHRTLQQGFWKAIVDLAKRYGEDGECDARNEDSVEFCKKLVTLQKQGELPYMRFI